MTKAIFSRSNYEKPRRGFTLFQERNQAFSWRANQRVARGRRRMMPSRQSSEGQTRRIVARFRRFVA